MSSYQPDNTEDWVRDQTKRLGRVERRGRAASLRGNAAARDQYYGVPTTDAQRLALGGSRWYDTDLGLWYTFFVNYLIPGAPQGLKRDPGGWGIDDTHMPWVQADLQASVTLTAATPVTIPWRSTLPEYDPFQMFSLATPTRIMTAPWSGLYNVKVKVRTNGVTAITVSINRNGASYARAQASAVGAAGAATMVLVDAPVLMTAGQYLEVVATSVTVTAAQSSTCFFEVAYMGMEPKR